MKKKSRADSEVTPEIVTESAPLTEDISEYDTESLTVETAEGVEEHGGESLAVEDTDEDEAASLGESPEAEIAVSTIVDRATASLQAPLTQSAMTTSRKYVNTLTDSGNALAFRRMFLGRAKFVPELDTWKIWNGKTWISNRCELMILVSRLNTSRHREASFRGTLYTSHNDTVTQGEARAWAYKSESKSHKDAMLELVKNLPGMSISQDQLDQGLHLIGVGGDKVLDLTSGMVRDALPEEYITKSTKAFYNKLAKCPTWLDFIKKVTADRKDLADYIQEILGYSLCGSTEEQQMFVLTGKGANGKSTLLDVWLDVIGDYGNTTPAHTLMKSESRAIRNDIARLHGSRCVSAVEINSGKELDEAMVKRLTGGDKITARFIGKEYFEFTPQAKFFLAVNTLPEVSGADDGIYRRIRIVPFDVSIPEEEMEKGLPEALKAERDGILAWAVEGYKRWRKNGKFSTPDCVIQASKDFRDIMDTIGSFLGDCCTRNKAARVPVSALYDEYLKWAKEACIEPAKLKSFGILVRQQGFKQEKSGSTRFWKGLTLNSTSLKILAKAS